MVTRISANLSIFLLGMTVQVVLSLPIFTVKLNQQHVPVRVKGQVVAHKTAYFGYVHIGYPKPQNFSVVFDTGSAHFFLPSTKCEDEACVTHRQYNRSASLSAVDMDHDGRVIDVDAEERDQVSITFGTGDVVGDFVKEVVCIGGPANNSDLSGQPNCVRARLICALHMATDPFKQFAFDGVLGLGMESLALDPEFNFFHMMSQTGQLAPVFGFFISRTEGVPSEISFGGHNEDRVVEPLRWVPVATPERGYWQIKVHGVMVGGEKFDICDDGGCTAILDTGTSLLGVPRSISQRMHVMLARKVPDEQMDVNCRQFPGPQIVFDLGSFSIELGSSEYSQTVPIKLQNTSSEWHTICRSSLLPIDMPVLGPSVFLWGEPVLRKYYTAYDLKHQRVGFAAAVKPLVETTIFDQPDVVADKTVI